MNYLKKIGVSIGITFLLILLLTLMTTTLSYFEIIKGNTTTLFKILIPIISIFIGGIITGKKSTQKGWLEGVKQGIIIILLMFIISLILKNKFEFKNTIYYIILIISTTLGSMIGINFKAKADK